MYAPRVSSSRTTTIPPSAPACLHALFMRPDAASSWLAQNQSLTDQHQHQTSNSNQLRHNSAPLSPPRSLVPKSSTLSASFRSVFHRAPQRAPSNNSLQSSYSASSSLNPPSTTAIDARVIHPYAAMVAAPLPVVSSHDATEDEAECPVCLEPLSFSFRLPGEKPHIVPECGHALHEVSSCRFSSPTTFASVFAAILSRRHTVLTGVHAGMRFVAAIRRTSYAMRNRTMGDTPRLSV